MTTFEYARSELQSLASTLAKELDCDAVENITVPEPNGIQDELYFHKLVSWAYVAMIEAFPIALKQLTSLLRSSDSASHAKFSSTKEIINALRTVQSHNMSQQSQNNIRQKKLVDAWMATNGGTPFAWNNCCSALCIQLQDVFSMLKNILEKATSDELDKINFVANLRMAIKTTWPAHTFDSIVKNAADQIGLIDFDIVAYRKIHFDDWQKLANCFENRQSATEGVERAILSELTTRFGKL